VTDGYADTGAERAGQELVRFSVLALVIICHVASALVH
jgi:hypothetical protein